MTENSKNYLHRNPKNVSQMFDRVAKNYDKINMAMTFAQDSKWRDKLCNITLSKIEKNSDIKILDLACGSGDVMLTFLKKDKNLELVGVDFCEAMLEIADKKLEEKAKNQKWELHKADCAKLPFADSKFDSATISFGFRNFKDRKECLLEIKRVLKPNAYLNILEVSRTYRAFEVVQSLFMKKIVPFIAGLLGANKQDYIYLADTTMNYPKDPQLLELFEECGFSDVSIKKLAFGFVSILSARK